ncbi:MAG: hypothetical protein ACREBT_05870 [Thermoplasmata archaeon]
MAMGAPPRRPPPPAEANRYAYLVSRLRNRQITMEEATELFGVMDSTIHTLRNAMVPRSAPPPPPPSTEPPRPQGAAPSPTTISTDDLLTAGILLIGAGAGVASALRARSNSAPPPNPPGKPAAKAPTQS